LEQQRPGVELALELVDLVPDRGEPVVVASGVVGELDQGVGAVEEGVVEGVEGVGLGGAQLAGLEERLGAGGAVDAGAEALELLAEDQQGADLALGLALGALLDRL